MSVALVKEVFNHAPAELTPLERLVLLAIAEKAQDGDREDVEARVAYPSMEVLTHWTGKSPGAVRAALRRLEGRGYEVRVPCGTDKHGRPVYAYPGRATRYRVPHFPRREPPGKGVTTVTPSGTERRHPGDAIAAERGHPGDAITGEWRHGDDAMASPDARDGVTGVTPNQKEPEGTSPLPPAPPSPPASASSGDGRGDDPRRTEIARAAPGDAVPAELRDAFVDVVLHDLDTGATRTLKRLQQPGYIAEVLRRAAAEHARTTRADATAVQRMRLHHRLAAEGDLGARALDQARRDMPHQDPDSLLVLRQAMTDVDEGRRATAVEVATA